LMNMLNFVDGVDGLAAGMSAITAGTFAVIAVSYGRTNVGVVAAAACGAAIGFLPYNWRKGGARIFMGDSGSMLLGYLLAVIALQGVLKTAAAVSLITPLALLAIPILDTMFVVAKRLKHHQSIASPDRWHLHHRALNVGVPPRAVAAAFWLWAASLSGFTLALRFADYGNSNDWHAKGLIVLGGFAFFVLAVTFWLAFVLEILKTPSVRARNAAALALIEHERAKVLAEAEERDAEAQPTDDLTVDTGVDVHADGNVDSPS
ncbi:MAG: undecaprenyl/decaprenyl-phosphate alpha-N-acetylglucosaminyl 1-phosphate transferase, partial [Thermoleophilia bacterium]|nr:undecaprenyl/decaprenyl-phosphate alpha-N-acetylglucosaminyl 1-phosphate transferase [Thermoleophilia bacterium]